MNCLEQIRLKFYMKIKLASKRQKKMGIAFRSLFSYFPYFSLSLLFLTFFFSCTRPTYLGEQLHDFSKSPKRIVWLQVAALSEEHLALLKFSYSDALRKVSFENFSCMGKMWAYNLYKLRPKSSSSMLSQMTGSLNIKENCEDYKLDPIWRNLQKNGFKVSILESELSAKDSLLSSLKCKDSTLLKDVSLFSMNKAEKFEKKGRGLNFFHFQENRNINLDAENIYYDRACQKEGCFSEFGDDMTYTYRLLKQEKSKFLLLGRQFKYEAFIQKKDNVNAQKALVELDRLTNFFIEEAKTDPDLLFLVSFAAPVSINLPSQGKNWSEQSLKTLRFGSVNHSELLSSVFSIGPYSEYFCGIYPETDLFSKRIKGQ